MPPLPSAVLSALPATLLEQLLHGACGRFHLEQTGRLALNLATEGGRMRRDPASLDVARLGARLLSAAWEYDPCDGALASDALAAATLFPDLPLPREGLLAAVHGFETPPDAGRLREAQLAGEFDRVLSLCDRGLAESPGSLFWLREAAAIAVYRGELDWLESRLARFQDHAPRPLGWTALRLQGDSRLFREDLEGAKDCYAKGLAQARQAAKEQGRGPAGTHLLALRLAEAFWRLDRPDRAAPLWRETLESMPWLVSHLLMIHDRLSGRADALREPEGQVAVCLYSYNKGKDLDAALASLIASRLCQARLLVLDNGSGDATPGVLAAWRARCKDRLTTIRLPVNIGAPAARNWLLSTDEAKAADWIVFLDDDATVPEDWLERLFAAASAYPRAGVWGCKVVDQDAPWRIQSADFQLTEPPPMAEPGGLAPVYPRRLRLSGVHHEDMDAGQHDYLRPCASVTGCCHLFRRQTLEAVGGFDLRFNPTQYDDVEHDLRLCGQGLHPVYQGRLAVRHRKATGKSAQQERKAMANSLGNLYKLEMDFPPNACWSCGPACWKRCWRTCASRPRSWKPTAFRAWRGAGVRRRGRAARFPAATAPCADPPRPGRAGRGRSGADR